MGLALELEAEREIFAEFVRERYKPPRLHRGPRGSALQGVDGANKEGLCLQPQLRSE